MIDLFALLTLGISTRGRRIARILLCACLRFRHTATTPTVINSSLPLTGYVAHRSLRNDFNYKHYQQSTRSSIARYVQNSRPRSSQLDIFVGLGQFLVFSEGGITLRSDSSMSLSSTISTGPGVSGMARRGVGAAAPSQIVQESPWASGWAAGPRAAQLTTLWKRYRQALADRTEDGDSRAQNFLARISRPINAASDERLKAWRQAMNSRGSAAKWVKARAAVPATVQRTIDWSSDEILDELRFATHEIAMTTAKDLASRWDAGYEFVDRSMPNQLADIADHYSTIDFVVDDPPPVTTPPLPDFICADHDFFGATAFGDELITAWTPGHVDQYAPHGAPGLDGWTGDFLKQLDDVSKRQLCKLLDECNAGRFPQSFFDARTVGIPKGDSTDDRRPLTVLSALYRLWARRISRHASIWLDRHMPPEVYGARVGAPAADAAWNLGMAVDASRHEGEQLIVVALGQKQCFDRLCIDRLEELATIAGFPTACRNALHLYRRLRRYLFTDGQPTGHGKHLRGAPQGCPLAVHLCNLTSWAWPLAVRRSLDVMCASCLDDRLLYGTSSENLKQAVEITSTIDTSVGALRNNKNTFGLQPAEQLFAVTTTTILSGLMPSFTCVLSGLMPHCPGLGGPRAMNKLCDA